MASATRVCACLLAISTLSFTAFAYWMDQSLSSLSRFHCVVIVVALFLSITKTIKIHNVCTLSKICAYCIAASCILVSFAAVYAEPSINNLVMLHCAALLAFAFLDLTVHRVVVSLQLREVIVT